MRLPVRRNIGLGTGATAGLAIVLWLHAPGQAHLRAPGPMNPGHAELACDACHRPAPGTLRQQLQNAARDRLGLAAAPVDIGYRAVGNEECMQCHVRPDDRHPVYRFREPRFAAARAELHPEHCASCHREHAGARATASAQTACRTCHAELVVERDPLDVPHRALLAAGRWDSCLGCHDFHGNHGLVAPTRLEQALPASAVRAYLRAGPSPYPPALVHAVSPEGTP
ncbi:MAG: cytochrome c3 family protein [Kofleriaceae bacterium]|nr:cytochrome c3 family protein [Kofleriaceae bacterium]